MNNQKLLTKLTLFGFICISLNTHAQLSQQLIEGNKNLYEIKSKMKIYFDSLKTIKDSASFYAEGFDIFNKFFA
jgi:hypothetical protein